MPLYTRRIAISLLGVIAIIGILCMTLLSFARDTIPRGLSTAVTAAVAAIAALTPATVIHSKDENNGP